MNGLPRQFSSLSSHLDCSPAHSVYQTHARIITEKMVQHFADNPHVIGWQVDNEFGDRCYSITTRTAFHAWLREQYVSLDVLNTVWGTRFWSHVCSDWVQIPVPIERTHGRHNPGLHLDYNRFMSDLYLRFGQMQMDILRAHVPAHHFITHNFMGFSYSNLDYFKLAEPFDFVSLDNYPRAFWRDERFPDLVTSAINHDTMRGLKGKNFWMMEAQSGHSGWHILSGTPKPGEIALWAYQSIAHGADAIVFFRWRTYSHGAELNWQGILDHDGEPCRRYAEVARLGKQLHEVDNLVGSRVEAHAAILHDYDTLFSFQIGSDHPQFRYEMHVTNYYWAFYQQRIPVAMLGLHPAGEHGESGWSQYPLLIAPALRVVEAQTAQRLLQYVEDGGTLVLTLRSGSRNPYNAAVEQPLPGTTALPVEFTPSHQNGKSALLADATLWVELLQFTPGSQATALCHYADEQTNGHYAGRALVSLHRLGKGVVLYVGTAGNEVFIRNIVQIAVEIASVQPVFDAPNSPDVEIAAREREGERWLFFLNHNPQEQHIPLPAHYVDRVTHETVRDSLILSPFGVRILVEVPD